MVLMKCKNCGTVYDAFHFEKEVNGVIYFPCPKCDTLNREEDVSNKK